MGQGPLISRRGLLGGAGALALAACGREPQQLQGGWVGATPARGHRLRQPLPRPGDAPLKRTGVLIVGGGVAGLACARALQQRGVDFALLELEDQAGGNARGHAMQGLPCPLGAHYLPLPGPAAPEVQQLLMELGLAREQMGRVVYDERHLCHSPQERLFFEGHWVEGLLPPADGANGLAQYRRFGAAVGRAQRQLGFAMPTHRAGWRAGHAALDAQTFDQWLDAQQLNDTRLRWYLDYCCRDDFGAGSSVVSAWAGLHYFASRHGFHAPGDAEAEREPVLTWPEGNGWITARMAAGLGEQLKPGRTVLRVEPGKHQVEVLAWNETADAPERWSASQLVLATPLFIAQRLLGDAAPAALVEANRGARHAPWLVANLLLAGPLLDRPGAPPAWDNVAYGSRLALGYVDAGHQGLSPQRGPTVLSSYWALPESQRPTLLQEPWQAWAGRVRVEMEQLHPDLPEQLQGIDIARWGHAMSIPVPGRRGSAALQALRMPHGRMHFAHADLAAYSVFEEAFTLGHEVGHTAKSH
ncbi:FAD-dependent oxidoreductase [Pelomonas sp. V22]|uniref:flavin monoamine oxidase family protein n=1 Tax=Pelomonas sp. V22 TaxID=2822139 RepID=UPI0024A8E480|nr:FAD-dependent oxidoreductase [Pelomonas sp. V22]MDI4632127.1 FAD-dependent oxidoreductase [Pelomonas sp. V22]